MDYKITQVQAILEEENIDGWLLYDFQNLNPIAREFLGFNKDSHISRRFYYYIPKRSKPICICHKIEQEFFQDVFGEKKVYDSYSSLEKILLDVLKESSCVAMEYSPKGHIPYLSKVDMGTIEFVQALGPSVISSAKLTQKLSSCLTESQIQNHKLAASFLNDLADQAFRYLSDSINQGQEISEFDLQTWIHEKMKSQGFLTEHPVICAFGSNTASPHYCPSRNHSKILKRDELILIDIFTKKNDPDGIYADICRMGYSGSNPPAEIVDVVNLVHKAQNEAFDFINKRLANHQIVKGFEVDDIAREIIREKGFDDYFTHRTGHNLHKEIHGPGAQLDGFETIDDRPLIESTAYTIEPGIYFQNDFGVRLEIDFLIEKSKAIITTPLKNSLILLEELR